MSTLKVTAPFTVQLPPPEKADPDFVGRYVFPVAGTYDDVPSEVAEHWFTKAHLEGYEAPPVPTLEELAGGSAKVMQAKPEPAPRAEPHAGAHAGGGTHSSKAS